MEQLQQAVNDAFGRVLASGAVEAAIEKNIAETIQLLVRDQLRPYSPFAKALEEQVSKALQVDFAKLDLPSYGQQVLQVVRRLADVEMGNQLAKTVEKQLAELLAHAPAEMTLRALVDQFVEHYANHYEGGEKHDGFTLIVEPTQYSGRWIAMDPAPRKGRYECSFSFLVTDKEQKVGHLRLDRRDMEKTLFVGPLYGFERVIFQMHAAGTRLTDLDEDISTYYPGRD